MKSPIKGRLKWEKSLSSSAFSYTCGYCETFIGATNYFTAGDTTNIGLCFIRICPKCTNPTIFFQSRYGEDHIQLQIPSNPYGENIKHLPSEVEDLYNEARNSFSVSAYTATVMCARIILAHVAVEKGADPGLKFVQYINYLDSNNFLPADSKEWVDEIRNLGNDANHEIKLMNKSQAKEILGFTEMLLKLIYEFPGKIKSRHT